MTYNYSYLRSVLFFRGRNKKTYMYTTEQRPIIHTRLLLLHHKHKNSTDVRYSTIQAPTHSASETPWTHSSHPRTLRPFPQPLSVPPQGVCSRFFEALCVTSNRCFSPDVCLYSFAFPTRSHVYVMLKHGVLCLPAYSNLSLCVSYLYVPVKTSVVFVLSNVISTSIQLSKFATYQQVPTYIGQEYPQSNDGTVKTWLPKCHRRWRWFALLRACNHLTFLSLSPSSNTQLPHTDHGATDSTREDLPWYVSAPAPTQLTCKLLEQNLKSAGWLGVPLV